MRLTPQTAARRLVVVLLVLLGATTARANGPDDERAPVSADSGNGSGTAVDPARFQSRSQSVGTADRGRLQHGVRLTGTATVDARRATYGTRELVELIHRAGDRVTAAHPGTLKLSVGDLSGARGGRIRPHRSHQSGRDADIGFYLLDDGGQPAAPGHFVRLDGSLSGTDHDVTYRLDVARTWALLVALLQDPVARVQYVFVAQPIRDALLAHAEQSGAPTELLERARTVLHRDRGNVHKSHLHVRIYCPVDDRQTCFDEPPYHEWYVGSPPPPSVQRQLAQRRAAQHRAAQRRAALRRAALQRAAQRRAAQRRAAQRRVAAAH